MIFIQDLKTNWQKSFKAKSFRWKVGATLFVLVVGLLLLTNFLTFIEYRPGIVLPDPILDHFMPVNLSLLIFLLTYGSIIGGALLLIRNPNLFFTVLHGYMIILLFRVICLYFVPLEPPQNIIPLHDAILESSFYSGRLNLKDLFFSGHTAALCLFYFAMEKRILKNIFLLIVIIVGSAILIQHVHYTIDVVLAPFFAWISFSLAKKMNRN
jgi:hypothetical protein